MLGRVWRKQKFHFDPNRVSHFNLSFSLTLQSLPMFRFLQTTFSPVFFQTHPWLSFRFISTTSKSKGNSFTISYLIDTCSFSPQRAASASKHLSLKTREKPDSVIEFFKNLGFSQTQLFNVIATYPRCLLSEPEITLKPKIEFFKTKGFSNSDIPKIINGCPNILNRSLKKQIIPCFDFFNTMFHSKDKLMKVIIRHSGILYDIDSRIVPNMKLLRQEGVPESNIVKLVEYFPRSMQVGHTRFKDIMKEVKELEFNPLRVHFIVAIHVKVCLNRSVWARKEDIYRRWGWSDNDIRAAFRVYPFCMSFSEKKIEGIMDFLVNKLGFESSGLARLPMVMSFSLEKRIIPRGSVILVLLSKGLVKQLNLSAIFITVEKVFLGKFIYCHENHADELLKLYRDKLALAK